MVTNFEGFGHKQLLAMIESIDPQSVKTRGELLSDIAKVIQGIGESLKNHKVTGWDGEAAQAFQDWVGRAGSATLRLGQYSADGGKWMTEAGQVMVEVKANMPKYDTAAEADLQASREYHNDPDAQTIGREAHSKLTGDHERAIQQLTKLAQAYDASATHMGTAQVPTFPPPPAALVPKGFDDSQDVDRGSGQSVGRGNSPYEAGASPSAGAVVAGRQQQPESVLAPTAPTPVTTPDRDVRVDLDTVAPPLPTSVRPASSLPPTVGPTQPVVTPGVPPLATLPIAGPEIPGGGPIGKFPATSTPVGKVGGPGVLPGVPPRDTGITGGRPVATGGPNTSIPRGTVIGAEGTPATGRGMGGMMGGMGGGVPQGGSAGSVAGRRLVVEPGGGVGGRQSGVVGQPVTQGGFGLVRNNAGGAVGPVGTGAGIHTSGRRQAGERPDYLAEDEETWQPDRRVLPPVVD